jgi:death-on-curing protein
VRGSNLLESAMARPEQLACYGAPDAADLAASYGFGISRNRPFVDGNKRTAFVAIELFLSLNGFDLVADDAQCVVNMLNVSSGELSEAAFANWIRENIQPRRP